MKCKVCQNTLTPFFSLGEMPLVNSFLKKSEIKNEKKYDLSLGFCEQCYLVQLLKVVAPEELFSHYLYFSSTSTSFLEYCEDTANVLAERFKLNSSSLVMEIASNDGAQLRYFRQLGIDVIGVDPAKNIAELANNKGIPTLAEFFSTTFAKKYISKGKSKPNLIFGANVLAHVPALNDFLNGIRLILDEKGTAVFEFPYLKGLLENKFDTIYHEHVFYFSLIALINAFEQAGLEIYDVEQTKVQGGSLKIFSSLPGVNKKTAQFSKLVKTELNFKYNEVETYHQMTKNVLLLKKSILTFLKQVKREKKTIAAYSAPAKGNILLNFFGINENYLDFIVDKSEAKQGLYTPGTHLFVYPVKKVLEEQPDYLFILCWNIADEVIAQLKEYNDKGGSFVVPIPTLRVL